MLIFVYCNHATHQPSPSLSHPLSLFISLSSHAGTSAPRGSGRAFSRHLGQQSPSHFHPLFLFFLFSPPALTHVIIIIIHPFPPPMSLTLKLLLIIDLVSLKVLILWRFSVINDIDFSLVYLLCIL